MESLCARLCVAASAAAAAGAAATAATTVVHVPTLPYEAHSINDIDAWPALLAVGTRFVKLDIGVCTAATCMNSAWSTFGRTDLPGDRGNATRDCYEDGGQRYCCLCMRGDASTRPNLADPFNTTFDFVQFLVSAPPSVPRKGAKGDKPLYLGLDFGGSPGCNQLTTPPCKAGALIANWLLALDAAIKGQNLWVIPYGDAGIGGLMIGLDQACAGGGGGCTETQQRLQALTFPNEVGAPFPASDPANRVRVFNDDWTSIERTCAKAGIFDENDTDKRSETPFLWYEQGDEYEFRALFADWATCAPRPLHRSSNNTGIVAVSNVGPAMFETFTASLIGRGLSSQFTANSGPGSGELPGALHAPLLVVVDRSTGTTGDFDRWAVLAAFNGSVVVFVVPLVDGTAPGPLASAVSVLDLAAGAPLVALAQARGVRDPEGPAMLIASSATSAFVLGLNLLTGELTIIAGGALAPSVLPMGSNVLSAGLACLNDAGLGDCFGVFLVNNTAATCNVSLVSAASLSGPLLNSSLVQRGVYATGGGALTFESSGPSGSSSFAGLAVWGGVTAFGGASALFGAYVEVSFADGGSLIVVERDGLAQGAVPRRIGFGVRPHLSSLADASGTGWAGSGALVQLLATDSDCDCGLLLNNANFAHCVLGNPALDASPFYGLFQSASALMTYSFGALADYRALVNFKVDPAGPWAVDSALGVCHSSISHGKLAASASQSGALYVWRVAHPNGTLDARGSEFFNDADAVAEVATLAAHDASVVDGIQMLSLCGLPNEHDGLVWDQWRIAQAPLA